MKNSFFLFLLLPIFSFAQVQWASKVVDFSSQYDDDLYSANQILGFPNAMTDAGLSEMAWVPKKEDSPFGEYIQVAFDQPMRIQQVAIAESLNPGAISKITLIMVNGDREVVFSNKNPKPMLRPLRFFRKNFELTEDAVSEIRLELNTKAIPGSNQIDAIGISNESEPIKMQVEVFTEKGASMRAEPLSPNVNSNFAERLPIVSPDGNTLYFARKYHPDNIGQEDQDDIWITKLSTNGTWKRAQNPGAPLNNSRHNFVFATNPSGSVLYLANHYSGAAKDGISIIKKKRGGWSKPKPMPIEDFYNDNPFVSYHVSNDGKILLMAVQRDEGFGDRDLYVSFLKNGESWSRPVNLGPTVNTVGIESSVFIAADNRTIYFSSSGHAGYGGLDIYRSQRLDDSWTNWSKPQNMGPGLNSPQNEYNYTMPASGDYAYYTKDDGNRMSDIYRIPLPESLKPDPVTLITGRLIDAETKQPLEGDISIQPLKGQAGALETIDGSSDYLGVLPYGTNIGITAKKEGYWAVSEVVDLEEGSLVELDQSEGGFSQTTTAISIESDQPEVQKLQQELKKLDYELTQITAQPKAAPIIPSKKFEPKEDPELLRLRKQYASLNPDSHPAEEFTSKGGMSELDRLKAQYERLNRPTERPVASSVAEPSKDEKLEEMKRRYNEYHNLEGYETETDYSLAEEPSKPEISTDIAVDNTPDFETLEETVINELESQLTPQLTYEVKQTLIPVIKEEIRTTLPPEQRGYLDEISSIPAEPILKPVSPSTTADPIETALKEHLKDPVAEHLREQIEPLVRLQLKQEFTYQVKLKHEAALRDKLNEISTQSESPVQELVEETPEEPGFKKVEKDIIMVPIKKGNVIPLNNLFFDANKATLKQESFTELDRLELFLRENSNIIVEIGGHTNGWCSHEFAKELSENRAKVVVDFLLRKGISASRISYHGYGKTQPIAPNNTASGRKKNQRVELKIVEILSE